MKKVSLEEQAAIWEYLQTDPLLFAKQILKIDTLWWGAEEIIKAIFTHKRVTVQSGHSLSKDWSAGLIALQWLFTYYPSKVICTAPTQRQVQDIMFLELAKHFHRYREVGPWPVSEDCLKMLRLDLGEDWFAIGFTTSEGGDRVGKFMGFKSPNMLVIVSEAEAVKDNVYDQIEGILTSSNSRILEIGNPVAPEGRFWEHCTQPKYGYFNIKRSCLESPNYIAQQDIIPGVVTYDYVEEHRRMWGEDHPYWISRILGEFPQWTSDSIIPITWIMRAVGRHDPKHAKFDPDFVKYNDTLKVGGLDVAKGGDETVHVVLTGKAVTRLDGFHEPEIAKTVGWAKNVAKEEDLKVLAVDEGGLAGVVSFLDEDHIPTMGIQFGGEIENDDFDNLGALIWWTLRLAFEAGEISIPDDPILIGQLARRRYEYTSRGKKRIKLESKRHASAQRGEESPDRGDGVAMAWWARIIYLGHGMGPAPAFTSEASSIESGKWERQKQNPSAVSEASQLEFI